MAEPVDIETTVYYFAEEILKLPLYPWQISTLSHLDPPKCPHKRTKISLCTPNGAGKSERIVATATLYWLAMFPQGKVVITSKSGLQLDSQVEPALRAHRSKFPAWKFIERQITTPTGGMAILFTTDEEGRAEGHHTVGDIGNGPVLIIVDEAKSVPEGIFQAFDRCTYSALLYVSSAGPKNGRFYESQFKEEMGFKKMSIGLKDCPHIPQERIDDIINTYGLKHPFTRSTLFGEFMDGDGESRFDLDGLEYLQEMVDVEEKQPTAKVGRILEQERHRGPSALQFVPDSAGWLWMSEEPMPGLAYIGWCDPMTGEQSEGAKVRDMHAAGIIRAPYIERRAGRNIEHDAEVVAVLHGKDGCRWYNDVLAERFDQLLRLYGDPTAIVEANNSGTEVMRLLTEKGRTLWRREKPNHRVPGKKMIDVVGFQTNSKTKAWWVGALSTAIHTRTLVCKYALAVSHFKTFILDENGNGQAQDGCHDDFVTGVGLGLFAMPAAVPMNEPEGNYYGESGGGAGHFRAEGSPFS